MTYSWEIAEVGFCRICSQGRQQVAREKSTGQFFILCEECEAEWDSPTSAQDPDLATRDRYGPCTMVRVDDLRQHPWFDSVKNKGP